MAGSNTDRSDTHRMLREQASRVYLQTIAANEREDRILNKKLDALDLEHRAQFLKMKRWIQDAHVHRKKRLKKMQSNTSYLSEKNNLHDVEKERRDGVKVARKERKPEVATESSSDLARVLVDEGTKDEAKFARSTDKNSTLQTYKSRRRCSSLLKDRVKYTESEVAHLKASFAGQKSPPSLRRRTFLPHLQTDANIPFGITTKRKNRATRQRKKDTKNDKILETRLSDLHLEGTVKERLPKISVQESKASSLES
eukprot:gene6816-12408_t